MIRYEPKPVAPVKEQPPKAKKLPGPEIPKKQIDEPKRKRGRPPKQKAFAAPHDRMMGNYIQK